MDTPPSQPTVYEPCDAQYGLFYWIYINSKDSTKIAKEHAHSIAKACSRIHMTAQRVDDPVGLKVGVGFGIRILERIEEKLHGKAPPQPEPDMNVFDEVERIKLHKDAISEWKKNHVEGLKSNLKQLSKLEYPQLLVNDQIEIKNTGGDIFVHAKGNSVGTLYEFQHLFYNTIRTFVNDKKSIITVGFKHQHHRDISGYMLGMTNPVTTEERRTAAVVKNTGGSYAITQKWEHNMKIIDVERPSNERVDIQDKWIGRKRESGKELNTMADTSHVKLMHTVKQKIVRQSLPYSENARSGEISTASNGLFFLAYAKDTDVFVNMLRQMQMGPDMIFKMSQLKCGTFWYFPGMEELDNLYNNEDDNEF